MRGTDTNPEAYNTRYYIGESEVSKETFDALDALRQQLAECEREKTAIWESYKDCRTAHDTVTAERNAFQDQCISLKMKMTVMREERDELVEALSSIRECLAAALFEGLQDRLAEEENTDVGSLYDLVTRRLLHMDLYAEATSAKLGADETGEK